MDENNDLVEISDNNTREVGIGTVIAGVVGVAAAGFATGWFIRKAKDKAEMADAIERAIEEKMKK